MSNLGMRILYDIYNKHDNIACERCFAPWTDMEQQLREHDIPLCSLESSDPLYEFDMVAFSIQYELCYTTLVNMLELGKVKLSASERGDADPLVICGGPCAYNGEPLADFVDLFIIGEGEEVNIELTELYIKHKKAGYSKEKFLREASHIKGIYVPSLYDVEYNDDGTIKLFAPKYPDVPEKVQKRIVEDMDKAP